MGASDILFDFGAGSNQWIDLTGAVLALPGMTSSWDQEACCQISMFELALATAISCLSLVKADMQSMACG